MTIGENGMNTGNRRRMMIVMMIVQRNLFYAGLVEWPRPAGKNSFARTCYGKNRAEWTRKIMVFDPLPSQKIRTFLDYRVLGQMVLSTSVAVLWVTVHVCVHVFEFFSIRPFSSIYLFIFSHVNQNGGGAYSTCGKEERWIQGFGWKT